MREIRTSVAALCGLGAVVALASCGGGGGAAGAGTAGLVTLVTPAVDPGVTGVAYTQSFDADFPHPPGVFLVTGGQLPPGISLDKDTGVLTGYPRQTGTYHFELAARDGTDPSLPPARDANFAQDARDFRLDVALGPPHILPQSLPGATYRVSYGYQIDLAGGTAPFTYAQTGGTLPTGVTVSPTGFVGNFPSQAQALPYTFQVTVTDANGFQDTATLSLQVIVLPLIILTADPITESALGFPYSLPLTLASPGGGVPFTWTQKLPLGPGETNLGTIGMEIASNGVLQNKPPATGPTALGTYTFSVQVVDEALQIATRQLTLKVNPGPVLTSISPNSSAIPGPYTASGSNFQPGAQLIFLPGPTQTIILPTFLNATTLTFPGPVPKPVGGNGKVAVMVKNPDGGNFTKPQAFTFPATNLAFATKGFVTSTLSSTGLDCADVNNDNLADIVHCGSTGQTVYSGSPTSTNSGLLFHKNLGGVSPSFTTVSLDGSSFYDCKFADVNVDGKKDIVALGGTFIRVFLGDGAGNFGGGITSSLPGGFSWPSEMWIDNYNSGVIPDVSFSVSNYPAANNNGRVYTMLGNGSGSFSLADSAITTMQACTGVISHASADTDGNGIGEILAGTGMNSYTSYPPAQYSATSTSGFFSGWTYRGAAVASPYYGSTTGICPVDFLGNGTKQMYVTHNGSTYNAVQAAYLFSGSGWSSQTTLATPAQRAKCCCAIDGDFDSKQEIVVSLTNSQVIVYRGSTGLIAVTLDATVGVPGISAPQVGRVAVGDINGDGAADILSTTSYWQTNGMAANYGSSYSMANTANGGQMGVVFWLNSSN